MAIRCTFESEPDLLRVTAVGIYENMRQTVEYGLSVIQRSRATGCSRVLCNETELVSKLHDYDTFTMVRQLSQHATKVAKVALVCRKDHVVTATSWETIIINRGLCARVFKSLEEAEEWLGIKVHAPLTT